MIQEPGLAEKLTPRQEAFALELAKGESQAAAYRIAYPQSRRWKDSSVWPKASAMAKNGKVRARVDELQSIAGMENQITIARVQRERARLAFVDPAKLYDANGDPLPIHEIDEDTRRAIMAVEVETVVTKSDEDTRKEIRVTRYKLANKGESLTALEKGLGIYADARNPAMAVLNITICC